MSLIRLRDVLSVEQQGNACDRLKLSKGVWCGFCGVEGPFMDSCWRSETILASRTGGQDSAEVNRTSTETPGDGLCYYCRKPGHFTRVKR